MLIELYLANEMNKYRGLGGDGPRTYYVNSKLGGGEGCAEIKFLRLYFGFFEGVMMQEMQFISSEW